MNTRHAQGFALLLLVSVTTLHAQVKLPASADQVPEGIAKADWQSIRAAYEAGRHAFEPTESGWQARNPGQQWLTSFDRRGFVAHPKDAAWQWGLELKSYGWVGREQAVSEALAVQAAGQRLSYQWNSSLQEWFINDKRGLEHGFTVIERLAADLQTELAFTLAVRGTLTPVITADAKGVVFNDVGGTAVLNYTGLKVWDANGKTLASRFESAGDNQVRLLVEERGARYPLTIDPIAQNAYVKASNSELNDQFGISVAVSGDTVVVGANFEDSNATGSNGNQADNSTSSAGAVYVFVRSGATWIQQAYLKASNPNNVDAFGNSVAIAGDTIAVGANLEDSNAIGINAPVTGGSGTQADNSAASSGAVYVFVRSGTTWTQQAYIKSSNSETGDNFGVSVAIAGNTLAVGAYFEDSSATGVNGFQADNSALSSGATYIFTRTGATWSQQAYLKASNTDAGDNFGVSLALSGESLIVGANSEDSSATGINGNQLDNTLSGAGAAYVFTRNGTAWSQQAYLKASNTGASDGFGFAVALSGDTAVIGASTEASNATGINGNQADNSAAGSGAAYVFVRTGSTWTQQAYIKSSNAAANDQFGYSVAIVGETIVVGARLEDSNATGINGSQGDNSVSGAGAAYLFRRNGATWSQQAYIKASNAGANDQFGTSMAISGDTLIVGAMTEASNATGINRNQADDSAFGSGAAYTFLGIGPELTSLAKAGSSVSTSDLAFSTPGIGALSPNGKTLFENLLAGSASTSGRNKAMFSTIAGPVDIALQTGTLVSGILGLPVNAKIATVTNAVHNRTVSAGLFQATVSGTGITTSNNRLLFLDNGGFLTPLRRTGLPVPEIGNALPSTFTDALQREGAADMIIVRYSLRSGIAGVNTSNDSGLFFLNHTGSIVDSSAREGSGAFGGGGNFGQFGRAAITGPGFYDFLAKFIPKVGTPGDALFVGGAAPSRPIVQGTLAGGTVNGERYGVFTGLGRIQDLGLLRATMTVSPATTNEGVWNELGSLLLRKGQSIGGGLTIARIIRVWGNNALQVVAQVQLGGTGVTTANNQALILRQTDSNFLILLRTGQPAPGLGSPTIKVASLQAIDVDLVNGHYTVLGSLSGAATSANQVLWAGQTTVGDNTTLQGLRLPKVRLQKGQRYRTAFTFGDLIRAISLKPAADASGVGARGLGQVINDDGEILLTITGDRSVQELVKLTP